MTQRKNNTGRSSGPYKKSNDKGPGKSFKREDFSDRGRNKSRDREPFSGKKDFSSDPNELASPRFLPKRSETPYRKKQESTKDGFDANRPSYGKSREGDRNRKSGTGSFKSDGYSKDKNRGEFKGSKFGKKEFRDSDSRGKRFEGDSRRKDEKSFGKPFRKDRNEGGDNRFSAQDKRRTSGIKEVGYEKPFRKDRNEGGDNRFSAQDKRRTSGIKEVGYEKPFRKDRNDGGDNRFSGQDKRRTNSNKEVGYEKPAFKKKGFDGDSEKSKPFRPKYDPEVKVKKSYTERKKELLGIKDDPDDIRLNKYIANAGICSRREADELIEQGLVTVNGTVVTEMGYRVKKTDTVKYDGRKILPEPFVYILMNKPKDFITTTDDDKGRKTVMDLLADKIPQRVYPIGRLDRNTTGVLLLTNDGEVAQALTHPSFQIKKVYHAVLDKKVSGTDLDKLVEGVELEDGVVHADAVAFVDNEDRRHVGVEIHSGKNRVVRRMFESLGYEVEKLDRVSMGIFTKKDLPRGKWRFLKESEIGFLMKLKSKLS